MVSDMDPQPRSLADSINASTRKAHSTLNKLIVARLPEALPPRAADPSPYISGLLHIAPVYIQFEGLWQSILNTSPPLVPTGSIPDACDPTLPKLDNGSILTPVQEGIKVHRPLTCERLHSMLEHLQLPGLMRSSPLRADLRSLTRWPNHDVEDELKKIREMGPLADFLDHMRRSVENKPHVLVAYAYIFYMALFAGGRFIRASLEYAGPEFWDRQPSPIKPNMRPCEPATPLGDDEQLGEEGSVPISGSERSHRSHKDYNFPLRFLHFMTPLDGEDLKKEFKERLADAEAILTSRERVDIIQESVAIFDHMTLVVGQLHVLCAEPGEAAAKSPSLGLPKNLIMARLRDSLAVAKDRRSARRLPDDVTTSSEGGYDLVKGDNQSRAKSSSEGNSHALDRTPANAIATPKSVRFEGMLSQSGRKQPSTFDGTSDITELIRQPSVRNPNGKIVRWVLAIVVGMVVLASRAFWPRIAVEF